MEVFLMAVLSDAFKDFKQELRVETSVSRTFSVSFAEL